MAFLDHTIDNRHELFCDPVHFFLSSGGISPLMTLLASNGMTGISIIDLK